MKEAKIKIKEFLSQYFGDHLLQDNEDIFALGFVNSMFAMQLVLFMEKEFQISVENEDLELQNFQTVNAMVSLLERKSVIVTSN